jgi:methylmalonyl-CoA mutase cobalamin-binding subunit
MHKKSIIGCSLSKCIHISGVHRFLTIAQELGYETHFLGPAQTPEHIISWAKKLNPDYIAISYRLTPETGRNAIVEFIEKIKKEKLESKCFLFGGTNPMAREARELNFFDFVFDGNAGYEQTVSYLKGIDESPNQTRIEPQSLVERIKQKKPFPIIRHHFGLPDVDISAAEIEKIAEAKVLDIICLGTDQDAQENFFDKKSQNITQKGAGGVPVRSEEDFRQLFDATRRGNYPIMRTYAGTKNIVRLAEIYCRTINLCSTGIPIFWYNKLDGRGPADLEESIREHQDAIAWHAKRNIPVEILDPHQWSMRGAHDTTFVVSAFISALLCKHLGVNHYIAQFMFNSPAEESFKMDLAKILASMEMIEPLADSSFGIYKMTRTGLLSFPTDEDAAKGHMASSTMLQLSIDPDIVHVVAYCEANHAATAKEVIESCKMVQKIIENSRLTPFPDMKKDPEVMARKEYLVNQSKTLLKAIMAVARCNGVSWISPENLSNCVRIGLLDAPQLTSQIAKGQIRTMPVNGGIEALDSSNKILVEEQRTLNILSRMETGGISIPSVDSNFNSERFSSEDNIVRMTSRRTEITAAGVSEL